MSTNAERLGRAVLARRKELDLNQLEVSAAGGPSNTTMTAIENGMIVTLSRVTARRLDKGLQWEPGSARAVYDHGQEPRPLVATSNDRVAEVLASDLSEPTKRWLIERISSKGGDGDGEAEATQIVS